MMVFSGESMGSIWQVKIAEDIPQENSQTIQAAIELILTMINQKMSIFIPHSEIEQLSNHSTQALFPISKELRYVLSQALTICEQTHGVYDITIAPLVNAWGFGSQNQSSYPTIQQIETLLDNVDYRTVILHKNGVIKTNPSVRFNLNSIAKGFAVDKIADLLESLGYHHYLIEIGGETRLSGNKKQQDWLIGIERPQWGGEQYEQVFAFKDNNIALATSGNYKNYIDRDNLIATHEINTQTGYPQASSLLSVTVLDKFCMKADSYATALFLLGDKAFEFAEKYKIAALFIVTDSKIEKGYKIIVSSSFQQNNFRLYSI